MIDDNMSKCFINRYWHFLNTNFRFEPEICNGCHDLMRKSTDFNDVVIVTIYIYIYIYIYVYICPIYI